MPKAHDNVVGVIVSLAAKGVCSQQNRDPSGCAVCFGYLVPPIDKQSGKRGKLKPWKDVARKINLSAQGCINIHDKAIKELSSKIDNEKIKF